MIEIGSIVWGVKSIDQAVSFWTQALHYKLLDEPSEGWAKLGPIEGKGIQLSLNVVTSPKARRHHLDLFTDDKDAEIERLIGIGANPVDWDYEEGADYTVLADPDGNRFCVVQK